MAKHLIVIANDDTTALEARDTGEELQRITGLNVTVIVGALQVIEIDTPE